ncbi:MtrAB system histidine kinase MtrB [Kocuria sp. HSID16901]|uniref:MtrAB system histidine kinase MtrB n=1 Tax=Kocuria sp. HSID16901 TaxID=2419505 RepID=UPI00069EFFE2|nr:MtrAB system histidine kinase MtrB [Kocuria sp. HSID16901]RUQ22335.1 sensor histidine kinase [Kocuria sp. HSID16901]
MARHTPEGRGRRILGIVPAIFRDIRRRWRESLQFSAIIVATSLSLVAFIFAGNFLSSQIANSLFKERQEQALEESSSGFSDVQKIFDNAVASDQTEVQSLMRETLTILENHGADAKRQWILIPVDYKHGQGYVGPISQNDWMTSSSVPKQLQDQVASEDGVFWQSSQVRSNGNGPEVPVIFVGTKVHLNQGNDYALYLVYDFSSSQATLNYIQLVIVAGFAILLVFVATIVWWVTRSVIRPISQTARSAERLSRGHLGERVAVRGENEAAVLGTSFNHMADNIQEQIVQLETLSKMQQRFVSDVSHELRTPLTTVKMAAELLYSGRENLDVSFQRSTELLYHQVDRFESLLADLLEISRFDAGSATLDVGTADLGDLVEDTVESVRPHLDKQRLEVRFHGLEERCPVQMDSRRIERVVRNLLVNAIEHSEGRPIDVYLASNGIDAAVAVRDHGVGMTMEQTREVFNRFWRADPSRKRTLGGTGLGLSIAAEDTRLHQGRLEAWGEPGQGACFRLTLPLDQGRPSGDSPLGLPPEGVPDTPSSIPAVATGTDTELPEDADSTNADMTVASTISEDDALSTDQELPDNTGSAPGSDDWPGSTEPHEEQPNQRQAPRSEEDS